MNFRQTIEPLLKQLDAIGFDAGAYRISLYSGLKTLVVIVAVLVLARLASRLVKRVFKRITRLDPTQQLLGEKLVSIGVWVIAILIGIDMVGIDLTALTVFSGAFGLAVGFGLQKTFGNLIAGIILLMDRSIKPGDVIAVNDGVSNTVGQVKKIGIRAVSVTTRDKKEYLIPNENLMINQVENWSYSSKEVRIRVPVIVAPTSDLDLAERLMLEASHASPRILNSPAPAVWLMEFAEAGIAFEMRVWINDPEEGLGSVRSDVLKRVWKLFKENGVELPNPAQRDVRMFDAEKPLTEQ
ncbi:MAG TPA: mechanosensitive ion channel domain-containing protein [Novosphingobium sp.]|nr:mechanosensitive ion channel domain-containing protein [Novosphingobium sp.]